jgi:hypothetical protein
MRLEHGLDADLWADLKVPDLSSMLSDSAFTLGLGVTAELEGAVPWQVENVVTAPTLSPMDRHGLSSDEANQERDRL